MFERENTLDIIIYIINYNLISILKRNKNGDQMRRFMSTSSVKNMWKFLALIFNDTITWTAIFLWRIYSNIFKNRITIQNGHSKQLFGVLYHAAVVLTSWKHSIHFQYKFYNDMRLQMLCWKCRCSKMF